MNTVTTLLVDIEHPDAAEPLRLMCGRDFTVLRTDNTGRDIYGFAHEDQEYLLVPFSFETTGENTLAMRLPASYEEWFMDLNVNGARIRLRSPHGESLFTHMPAEYRSGTGVLNIDQEGRIAVTIDRTDPAHCAAPGRSVTAGNREKVQFQQFVSQSGGGHSASCACGHDHSSHGGHSDAGQEAHSRHQHEHTIRVHVGMSDPELADTIRKRVDGLNLLLQQACSAGLEVDLSFALCSKDNTISPECPQLTVNRIAKLL